MLNIKRIFLFFVLSIMVIEQSAWASCTLTGSTCLDSTPCKNINGATVCLSNATVPAGGYSVPQTCWNTSNNYNCSNSSADTCGTVTPTTCSLNSSTCATTDPTTGACSAYTRNYTCQAITGAPTAVNACQGSMPSTYVMTGQSCIQSDVYPMVYTSAIWGPLEATAAGAIASAPGLTVPTSQLSPNPNYGTCLTYMDSYSGSSPSSSGQTCTPIPAANLGGCSGGAQTCTATNANGLCTTYSQNQTCNITNTYQTRTPITTSNTQGSTCNNIPSNCVLQTQNCLDTPPGPITSCQTVENVYSCPGTTSPPVSTCTNSICVGQNCYGKTDAANTSLAPAATALEMARQLGSNFNQSSMTLFYGEYHDCSVTLGGLFGNCCTVKSSPQPAGSDLQAMVSIGMQYGLNSLAASEGSPYVFNTLMSSSSFASDALAGMGASGVTSASFAGITATVGPGGLAFSVSAASLASFIGVIGNMALSFGAITPAQNLAVQIGTDFAAYAADAMTGVGLAIAVAMTVMQYLSTCSNQENQLAVLRGKNICHQVGSWCSEQVPLIGLCLQTKTSFCCFNSKLALLVNEQGRPQIGKSWGAAQSPDCSGFTVAQIGSLNFSAMNLSAAFSDMMSNVNMPNQSAMMTAATNKISSFYSTLSPGSGSTATPAQLQTLGTVTPSYGPVNPNTVGTIPTVPSTAAAACTAVWGAKTPDTFTPPDYTSSINITSCVPGATLDLYYTGNCSALLSGFPLHFAFDGTGSASSSVNMPAACLPAPATATSPAVAGSSNSWAGTVVTGGNFSSKVGITW